MTLTALPLTPWAAALALTSLSERLMEKAEVEPYSTSVSKAKTKIG